MLLSFIVFAIILLQLFSIDALKLSALDSNILFEGRCDIDERAKTLSFDQPGTKINLKVKGTRFVDILLTSYVVIPNRFWVVLDGVLSDTVIDTITMNSNSISTVRIASNLDASSEHTISIAKITEAQFNSLTPTPNFITVHGFEVEESGRFLALKTRTERRIEFIGDSITAGYCDLCGSVDASNGPYTQESNYLAYGTLTCGRLSASCHTAAWSGYGMVRNCCGGSTLMPEIYSRTLASVPGSLWNMSSWKASAVVINLGTNDHLDASNPAGEYETSYVQTYTNFVLNINKAYSSEKPDFFLACGPMSSSYCGYVLNVLDAVTKAGVKATFLDMTHIGVGNQCCGHPSKDDQVLMSDAATKLISEVKGWY